MTLVCILGTRVVQPVGKLTKSPEENPDVHQVNEHRSTTPPIEPHDQMLPVESDKHASTNPELTLGQHHKYQ